MTVEVELPDGQIVEVDTDDPEVAAEAARKFLGSPKPPGITSQLLTSLEATGRGALSTVGLGVPVDVAAHVASERIGQGAALATGRKPEPATDIDTLVAQSRERGQFLRENVPLASGGGMLASGFIPGATVARAGLASRAAATGAAGGASAGAFNISEEGGEGLAGDVATGALVSTGLGALGPQIANTVRKFGGAALRRFFPDRAAARVALERAGMHPDEIETAVKEFSAGAQRTPAAVEVTGETGGVELSRISRRTPAAKDIVTQAEDAASLARQEHLAGTIPPSGRKPISPAGLTAKKEKAFVKTFAPIRNKKIDVSSLTDDEFDNLVNTAKTVRFRVAGAPNVNNAMRAAQNLRQAQSGAAEAAQDLSRAFRSGDRKAVTAAQHAVDKADINLAHADAQVKDNPLTMDVIDKARRALGKIATTPGNPEAVSAGSLAEKVEQVGSSRFPQYRTALEKFGRQSEFIEEAFGAKAATAEGAIGGGGLAARAVSGSDDPRALADAYAAASRSGKAGARSGQYQRLIQAALKSPENAENLTKAIARNAAFQKSLRIVLGDAEGERIINLSKLEFNASRAFRAAASGARPSESGQISENIGALAKLAWAGKTGGAALAHFSADLADKVLIPPKAAEIIARDFTDPDRVHIAIAAMRALKKSDAEILDALNSAAVSSGIITGTATAAATAENEQ